MYYLSIPKHSQELLGNLRHFEHLQMAIDQKLIWVKGFIDEEINSPLVRKIPRATMYLEKEGWLYIVGSKLREMPLPSLLFTPIQMALPIEIEGYNHNLFEINGKVNIQLVAAEEEHKAYAQLINIQELESFVSTHANFRFKHLKWCLINDNALVVGSPQLPIQGLSFWKNHQTLIPLGFNVNFPLLLSKFQSLYINGTLDLLLINEQNIVAIKNNTICELSRASVKVTLNHSYDH